MSFSINGNNGGLVVSPDYYLKNQDNGNVGSSIVDSALSNEDYGFSIVDTVEMMVAAQMGAALPTLQSEITNANVQQGALSQFQMTMTMFSQNTIKPLNQKNALTSYELTNSNPNAVKADISSGGVSGDVDLSLGVKQLAQSQSLLMGGFGRANDPLKTGSVTIDFGYYGADGSFSQNSEASSITIDVKGGMTLNDLAAEINKTSSDLKASVITKKDGTEELALISQKTGEQHSMRVSTSGDPSLSNMNYSGKDTAAVSEARKATNAVYSVNGIEMTSDTNKIDDLFGLNLTLTEITASDVQIGTSGAPEGVVENVNAFVENFNSMIEMFNSFNAESASEDFVGSLHGTKIADSIQEELDQLFLKVSNSGYGLSDIGIRKDGDGRLALDQDKLKAALEKDPEIAFKVLGSDHSASHEGVDIISVGDALNGEHTIIVDRNAEKAKLQGAPLNTDVVLSTDTEIKLKLGSEEVLVNLPQGTYTPEETTNLINRDIKKAGITTYSATVENGMITFNSSEYGSLQSIEVVSDVPEIGLTASKESGVDISGSINGERFLGDGTELDSKFEGSSKGMKIAFDPNAVTLGQPIIIGVSTGFLDNSSHAFETIKTDITAELKDIKDSLDPKKSTSLVSQLEEMEKKEEYYYEFYYNQFSGISAQLSEMTSTMEMMDMMFGNESD